MATMTIQNDQLQVVLTRREKIAGLHGDITVPLSAVRAAGHVDDALKAVKGLRAPGLALPGRTLIGTWRGRHGVKRFAVARRGTPAVRVELEGAGYNELIVSIPGAEQFAAGLREKTGVPATR